MLRDSIALRTPGGPPSAVSPGPDTPVPLAVKAVLLLIGGVVALLWAAHRFERQE